MAEEQTPAQWYLQDFDPADGEAFKSFVKKYVGFSQGRPRITIREVCDHFHAVFSESQNSGTLLISSSTSSTFHLHLSVHRGRIG
jgi:hypothetical protein